MTAVLCAPGLAVADEASNGKETTYYISLGDSLATGYQPDVDKDTAVAYTDQLYTQLKRRDPNLQHIRLGCTGETTESLIKGGRCDYPQAQSQLDAALKALAQHKGKVAYVSLSVGANDIQACVGPAETLDAACLNTAGQAMGEHLTQIAAALRKAGTEHTQYTGSTYYNPFLAAWLTGTPGQKTAEESAPLIRAANRAISQVYGTAGFEVADVAGAYSSEDSTTLVNVPGAGVAPKNVAKICQLTWTCTDEKDPHPNADGHKVIAGAFSAVLAERHTPHPTMSTPSNESASSAPTGKTEGNNPTTDGDLAETGASNTTPALAGAGLAIVLAGSAGVYFARRHRATDRN
ncbi:GDSL-type esterase/lipase family protein [Streptomyces sp. NPDC085932]|uniref:GDSL-type esterase/lipase family protein n=1 Tax=Streptomyces sp. NPDC085932 TaxID=3365741 RepID=UPI0037D14F1D